MIEILCFLVVAVPLPLLAVVLLVARLRRAVRRWGMRGSAARALQALRKGARRPVWLGLIATAAATAGLIVGLEQAYLAGVSRQPGWFDVVLLSVVLGVLAAGLVAVVVGMVSAAVARARGFGAGTVAGLLTLLAVAAGTATAHLPLRAGYLADPGSFPVVPSLGQGDLLIPFDIFLPALVWVLPWPVLGAAFGAAAAGRPAPRDFWQSVLELATADLPDNRAAWGAALRAELAAIDGRAERRSFALGGVWAALRSGLPQGAWLQALGVAVLAAGGTFAASRWSLTHDRGGILGFWVSAPTVLLFVAATSAAWRSRSFSAALRAATLAVAATVLAVLAVSIPEAMVWADRRAGYLSTGDAVPPDWQSAVADVLRPEFLVGMVAVWIVGVAGGAALGTAAGRSRTNVSPGSPLAPAGPDPAAEHEGP